MTIDEELSVYYRSLCGGFSSRTLSLGARKDVRIDPRVKGTAGLRCLMDTFLSMDILQSNRISISLRSKIAMSKQDGLDM